MAENEYPAQVPFGDSINIQLSIQAYIETERLQGLGYTQLRFALKIGKEHFSQYEPISFFLIADGHHYGERNGPEWDALQLHWQKQYDYLNRHFRDAITLAALLLSGEASISYRKDWDFDVLLAEADIKELDEWAVRHTEANEKSGAWQQGEGIGFNPHQFVLLCAHPIWERLKHEDKKEIHIKTFIGGFQAGRFEQIEKTISQYPAYANNWRNARGIVKNNPRDEWSTLLKEVVYPSFFRFPDDLLDNLLETVPDKKLRHIPRPKYRPGQLALVHLARDAWLEGKNGSMLKAPQWQSIRRALDKFCDAIGKPRLKVKE